MRHHQIILGAIIGFLFPLILISNTFSKELKLERDVAIGEEDWEVEADSLIFEKETRIYKAHGKVEIKQRDFFLKADYAQLNMESKELEAWGNVIIGENEDIIECERLVVNLVSKTGKITKARIFLKDQNFHITGKEVEKLGENHYRVRDGSFTTCDGERPAWKFTVKELEIMELSLGGFGIAKGAVPYVKEIPVFYLPFGIFPVRRERQSGFLFPRIGYSEEFGPEIRNAFYWAFAKNMDATFYLDWLGDRGFKEGLEYRYALSKDTKGEARFYFIDDQVKEKNRYSFFIQHEQILPKDFYLKGDVNHISDHEYQRDFDEDLPEIAKIDSRSRQQLRSIVFGGKNWDRFTFIASGIVYDDLTKKSNDETVHKLPQLNFNAYPQSILKYPLFFEIASSYTNFWREKGTSTHRGDFFPKIIYPIRVFDVIKFETELGFRQTFYRIYQDKRNQYSEWESREIFEGGLKTSTEIYRIFDSSELKFLSDIFKVNRWMHTMEPEISYRYSPRVYQENLPVFDDVDRIPYTSEITYGITQRFIGRFDKNPSQVKEYVKLRFFQNYTLGDSYIDLDGRKRSFSNIKGELWLDFSPYINARWDAEYNHHRGDFDIMNFLLNIKDLRGDAFQTQYRFTKGNIKETNFSMRLKITKPLYVFGSIKYNLLEKWRIENIYGAQYEAQCWTLGFTIEDKNRSPDRTQRKEIKYQLYFNLLGIGSVGKKPFLMGL